MIWLIMTNGYRGFGQDVFRELVHVTLVVDDLGYAGIDEDLRTEAARERGRVECGTFDAGSMVGGLCDGVLLGMDTAAELVTRTGRDVELDTQTAGDLAMRHTLGCSVITGGENVLILDDDCTYMPAKTRGT